MLEVLWEWALQSWYIVLYYKKFSAVVPSLNSLGLFWQLLQKMRK